jgi:hypothetical protein
MKPLLPVIIGLAVFIALRSKHSKPVIEEGRYWIATLRNGDEIAMDSGKLKTAIARNEVTQYREI